MKRLVVAIATVAALTGGTAATMALLSGTAVAQTQSPTPQQSTPATPQRHKCPHDSSSSGSISPSTGTGTSTSFGDPSFAI